MIIGPRSTIVALDGLGGSLWQAARSVVRTSDQDASGSTGNFGTGWLVTPRLVVVPAYLVMRRTDTPPPILLELFEGTRVVWQRRAVLVFAGSPATRRAGLVDVHRHAPGIQVELDYLTGNNITGHRLPGYCQNWALMHGRAAFSLGQVQRYLRRNGLGLLILDAYRPLRATQALVRWAERHGRGDLVGTYIARRSRHNTGSAVDLTLVRLSDGKRLRMGGFDELGTGANTYNASGGILRNRLTLKNAMERFGFSSYWREWWHFEHYIRPNRYLDVTLGCGRHN
jgi:D-alanyl-D-alanine dipeptidase